MAYIVAAPLCLCSLGKSGKHHYQNVPTLPNNGRAREFYNRKDAQESRTW